MPPPSARLIVLHTDRMCGSADAEAKTRSRERRSDTWGAGNENSRPRRGSPESLAPALHRRPRERRPSDSGWPGGSANDTAEIAPLETRVFIREDVGLDVPERGLRLVLYPVVE